jgi:signal transduction histidine kinase
LLVGFVAGTVRHRVTVRLRRKLQELERIKAIERERTRIAQDIHDDLGSSLTLIAVLGDIVSHEKVDERLGKISNTARQAVKSLDEIVWAVNPRNDTLGHLIDYAGQFAVDYLLAAGINCFLDVPENPSDRELPSNIRHNVFLAIKEALQNIVKHAQATDVWLKVGLTPEGVQVVIEDNGRGFAQAPDNALADGLRNMRQRMSEIGGECLIESRIGGGTTITLVFLRPSP